MDFKIVTFYNEKNYGAVLQAYALQETLKNAGYSVGMQPLAPKKSKQRFNINRLVDKILKIFTNLLYGKQYKYKSLKFENFVANNIQVSSENANVYLAGSDQVWNPYKFDTRYFLDFVKGKSIKASYAASIGVSGIPNDLKENFKKHIRNIEFVSVREAGAKAVIENCVEKNVLVHIDPTLLLSKEEWRKNAKQVEDIQEKYVLLYVLHISDNINSLVDWLKKETGYQIVLIDDRGYLNFIVRNDKTLRDIGPSEFLWLFENAEIVITTSFHGTAFSIIFEKEFYSIVNPTMPSRINNLMELCGLQPISETQKVFSRNKPDYERIKATIANEKERSIKYLKNLYNEWENRYDSK